MPVPCRCHPPHVLVGCSSAGFPPAFTCSQLELDASPPHDRFCQTKAPSIGHTHTQHASRALLPPPRRPRAPCTPRIRPSLLLQHQPLLRTHPRVDAQTRRGPQYVSPPSPDLPSPLLTPHPPQSSSTARNRSTPSPPRSSPSSTPPCAPSKPTNPPQPSC